MDLIGRYDPACFSLLLPRTTLHEGLLVVLQVCQDIDLSDSPFNRSPTQFTRIS